MSTQDASDPDLSPEYLAARATMDAANREFDKVRMAYRARRASDEEFIEARLKHNAAQAAFDIAFNAERDRNA